MTRSLDLNMIPGGVLECECIYASGVYIKVNRHGVWQKSKADDDYVLVIPIDDEVKKNDNRTT